jgi:cytochrome P450
MANIQRAPGPRGHFLIGNLPEFGRDIPGFFRNCAQEYGDVVSFSLAGFPACLLNHPDYFEYVLVTNHRNFVKNSFFFRHLTDTFGKGVLTSEGDFWLRQRRLMQPAFHRERIAKFGQVMVDYAEMTLGEWLDGDVRQIHVDMMQLTMRIVAKTLFNLDVAEAAAHDISHAIDLATVEVVARLRRPFKIPDNIPIPGNLRYQKAVHRVNEIVYNLIKERRSHNDDRGDLLSMLMAARNEDDGGGMSDRQLRDEVVTLFLAGHETTAVALSWTWYLLAQHPEQEAKLFTELDQVLGGRSPTVDDLPRLPYTEMVIKEVIRLYPPAYAFGREAVADCEIGGYPIPRGTTIFLSPWVIHRDKRFFESPEEFKPERWDERSFSQPPKLAFLPFGGGPRLCIGISFAMMETTLILTTIAQKFKFRLNSQQEVIPFPSVTLRPPMGMQMTVSTR